MVDECNRKSRKGTADPKQGLPLPLIRLRVDYTGFSTINSQRFGQKFVSKVANPHDVLHWHKAAARKVAKVSNMWLSRNISKFAAQDTPHSLASLPKARPFHSSEAEDGPFIHESKRRVSPASLQI